MDFLSYFKSLDYLIFLYLNLGTINPFFDMFFPVLRDLTYVFWGILIFYFWLKKERKLSLLMCLGITAGATFTYFIKFLIDRERPYEQITSARLLTEPESDPSFPSGHSEISFLCSVIVSRAHPGIGRYLYAFSFLVALSRIYVGVHFPTDVIGGAIIGIAIGRVILKILCVKS